MTIRTRMSWRNAAGAGISVLLIAVGGLAVWYRATYHTWPGLGVPTVVHWCGRDYEDGVAGPQSWAQSHRAGPRGRHGGRHLPAVRPRAPAPRGHRATSPVGPPGQVCAMAVYLRTGPGRYQAYTLEGGP